MQKVKNIATKHPYLFMLLVFPCVPYLVMLISVAALRLAGRGADFRLLQDPVKILSLLVLFFALWQFGWLRPAGFLSLGKWQVWLVMLLMLIYELAVGIFILTGSFHLSDLAKMANPWGQLLTGLFEETLFRGVILYAFIRLWGDSRAGILKAVIVSSALFGFGHMAGLVTGRSFTALLFQSLYAWSAGIFLASLVLYGNSIWPGVLSHAIVNAVGHGNLNGYNIVRTNIVFLVVSAVLLLVSFGLLSKVRVRQVVPSVL